MLDSNNNLSLENIANVKIKLYQASNVYDSKDSKQDNIAYDVYILTYIKHIVRIKANLALHGGLYSNYFEKYEEDSISNIMLDNLIDKSELDKCDDKKGNNTNSNKNVNFRNNKNMLNNKNNEEKDGDDGEKRDLNFSIKELLKKLIKSYKIRENKIFLVTGMLGCGKTTCVTLAIEYFNKFLQIEKNMKNKFVKKHVLFSEYDNSTNNNIDGVNKVMKHKTYKKTPYTNKHYDHVDSSDYSSLPVDINSNDSNDHHKKKLKINYDEPLFSFTPKKDKNVKKGDKNTTTIASCSKKNTIIKNKNKYNTYDKNKTSPRFNNNNDDNNNNNNELSTVGISNKLNSLDSFNSLEDIEQIHINPNVALINSNIKDIFENDDLSPLRKNVNIRNKIQFEQYLKKNNSDNISDDEQNYNSDDLDDNKEFEDNVKYQKIINEIKKEENEERYIYTVRISAYLYRDDLQCIKSILTQLYNYINTEDKIENSSLLNDYIIKLEKILIQINNDHKQTLLIIENVEKFSLQNKQNLLYTLFDLLHKKNIFINIICVTNILDITQTLEKRIKSRFTFEMLHILPILNIDEISKLIYKILYVNLDDFHLIKKYYAVYFSYTDLIKIQKFLQIYNSTIQKEITNSCLLKQWSYDINYGLDIRHIYHTCIDAILSICEYKHIFSNTENTFKDNTLLDYISDKGSVKSDNDGDDDNNIKNDNIYNVTPNIHTNNIGDNNDDNTNFVTKGKRKHVDYLRERPVKLDCTPIKQKFYDTSYRDNSFEQFNNNDNNQMNKNKNDHNEHGQKFQFDMNLDMSPRKLKENIKVVENKIESQYILNNIQSKFLRRHYIKKVLRDLCSIEYMILCAFARLYKKELLPKTLYVIILEINKFKQAYPQEQITGFSLDAYRRSFFRLVDLDIIVLSSYSLNHLNIKNYSNDLFGLHEPTKFPCYDIFLENIDTYNLNHNLIQWVKHNIEVMQ
ncbi:conserved protein, unknown function [Hepatocystis sp. ex Piliocolobus tephrosceles]|nr:conserved protein, unknown function [Hepatocystis sp. ex Piliocolobus tephrosceles]